MSNQLTIAYHIANQNIAEDIQNNLSPIGYGFEHLVSKDAQSLAPQLQGTNNKILLIISDNFLKSEQSMHDLLEVFQDLIRSERVLPIITDGRYQDDTTGIFIKKPTSFDRMSDAIQYMNYWQDKYLDVRREKRNLLNSEDSTESKEEVLNNKLTIIRNISSDIGEFFGLLRSKKQIEYSECRAENFAPFFQFAGDTAPPNFGIAAMEKEVWEATPPTPPTAIEASSIADTVIEAEAPVEIASIPGMDLLAATPIAVIDTGNLGLSQEEETITTNPVTEEEDDIMDALDKMFEEEADTPLPPPIEPSIEEKIVTNTTQMDELNLETTEEEIPALEKEEDALNAIQILRSEDDIHGVLQKYETGLAQFPESVNLRYGYATSLIKYHKDFDQARQQLKTLVGYDTNNYNAHFLLAEIAEIKEDYADARTHFEQVLVLNPEHTDAPYRLANVLSNHFEGNEAAAGALFEKSISRTPDNADAHYQYAVLQDEYFDNPDTALTHYQKTIALDPEHPYAHYDMAVLYHGLEDMENAKIAYEQASIINAEVKTPQNDAAFLGAPLEFNLPPDGIIRDDAFEGGGNIIVEEEIVVEELLDAEDEALLEEEFILNSSVEKIDLEEEVEEVIEVIEEEEEEIEEVVVPEVLAEVPEVAILKSDIKRLEDLVLKNQNMLMLAQQNLNTLTEEEEAPPQTRVDKVVVITGASSGIGRATADAFAAAGYRLILTGRRTELLTALQAHYQEIYGSDVLTCTFDVREASSVQNMVDSLEENWQNIDILINNAGLAKGFAPIHEGEINDWDVMIDTNIKGLLYMTRAVSPFMVKRGSGQIINICSSAGHEVYPNGNVYCATKYAVDALTKSMRLDLHKHNIRVSQVSPGHVEETEFALTRFEGDVERAKIYTDFQPLKANDVAETIFFLATRPAHVNVQDVVIFGTQQASNMVIDRSGRAEA